MRLRLLPALSHLKFGGAGSWHGNAGPVSEIVKPTLAPSPFPARFALAFHHRQLKLYASKKIMEVAPAVTQSYQAGCQLGV